MAIVYKNRKNVKSASGPSGGPHWALPGAGSGGRPIRLFRAGGRGWRSLAGASILVAMPTESTMMIVEFIRSIPPGRVASYGAIAELSGSPGGALGARQVARILHSMSRSQGLPWWRVVKKNGAIALLDEEGRCLQRELLESEGVELDASGRVDMARFAIG